MTDLRTLLADAAGPVVPTAPGTVDDDLDRGRRALRRHRLRTRATRGVLAAAVVAAVAVGGSTVLGSPAPPAASPAAGLELAAYTGDQPAGFDLATAPAGWVVRTSDPGSFVLAPPDAPPPSGPAGAVSYVDAVAVSLSADVAPDFAASTLTVGDRPAVWQVADDGTRTVYVERDDAALTVQVWAGLPLTDEQVVELAAGITVTPDAVPSFG
jgi:hypothetical protein